MRERPFIKMHGLGNDFVVIDARRDPVALDDAGAGRIADRRLGVGCDQLLVMEPPRSPDADVFLQIRNADGGEVAACGNGARCVAALIMAERGSTRCVLETRAGLLEAEMAGRDRVAVDMGEAQLGWADVPLAREMDTLHVALSCGPLRDPVAVGLGNPHAVFFVDDVEAVALSELGPRLERDALFPEGANIEVVRPSGPDRLRMRVWERGVGITRACGSGACAAAVAAARRGLTGRTATVALDGGELMIDWRDDGHVVMTGPVATAFRGVLNGGIAP